MDKENLIMTKIEGRFLAIGQSGLATGRYMSETWGEGVRRRGSKQLPSPCPGAL